MVRANIAFYGTLPKAVRIYRFRFPDVAVELAEMNSPALESALAIGEIDLAILHPPVAMPQLAVHELPSEDLELALPTDHRLAGRPLIPVRELEGEPFLIAPRSVGPNIHDRGIALFRGQDINPRIVQQVTPMTTLVGLVAAGVGPGFVTKGVSGAARPGVAFRPVSPTPPVLPIAAAWMGSEPSTPAKRFLEVVAGLHSSPDSAPGTL